MAIVHVGGQSELEMKEKKDRVEDALHATKAALEEGILPGGGVALLNAADSMEIPADLNSSEVVGYSILMSAIQMPFYTILTNAGYNVNKIDEILDEIVGSDNFWHGYNLRSEAYVDMFEEGIIDPAKVTRLALENASSIARTMLTTECVISNVKEDKKQEMDFNQFM